MRSHDTLVDTPFQLMLIKVFSVVSMLNKLPPGVCWRGRGGGATGLLNKGGRLPGLVTKQQAVEFPQILTSYQHKCTKRCH